MPQRPITIVGLGSVGRRHLANLRALGWTNVRACRSGLATMSTADLPQDVPVDYDLDEALAHRPLAVVIATPSSLHMPAALAAARSGAHLLIEKPVSHTRESTDVLAAVTADRDLAVLVGFQFRFHPGLRQLKQWIDDGSLGEVVSAQVHWGEYLPDLHPWEDFRGGYAARRDLGGGVLRTFCHPFDYLRWMLGDVDSVAASESSVDPFGLDVETSVDVELAFRAGATAHVHLDFIQRPSQHAIRLIGTRGMAVWSQGDHVARRFEADHGTWLAVPPPEGFERNVMFLEEMKHFLACLRGEDTPRCTLHDGIAALEISLAAETCLARAPQLAAAI